MSGQEKTSNTIDYVFFAASIIAIGFSAIGALGMIIVAGMAVFLGDPLEAIAPLAASASLLVMGLCSLPLLYLSLRNIFIHELPAPYRPSQAWTLTALLLPVGLVLGFLAFEQAFLPWILGPTAHVLAALGPVSAAVVMVLRRGPILSGRRRWGQFNTGLWVSPFLAFMIEMILLLPVIILLLTGQFGELNILPIVDSLSTGEAISDPALESAFVDFLSQPIVIGLVLLYLVILVPMVEEVIKTIAIWPFLKRGLTKTEAFLGGALAGAGYALFEAFFLAQPGENWGLTMIARAGATLIHMFTTGLTAIGLAKAAREHSFKKAIPYYLIAVAIHAIWNLCALAIGAGVIVSEFAISGASMSRIMIGVAVGTLILLSFIAYAGLQRFSTPKIETTFEVSDA